MALFNGFEFDHSSMQRDLAILRLAISWHSSLVSSMRHLAIIRSFQRMDSCAVCSMGFDHSSMYSLGFDHSDWPSHGTGLAKQFFDAFEWIPGIRSFFDALFSGHSAILRYAFEWIPDAQSGRWNSSMHHLSGNSAIHSMRSKYPSGSMSAEIQVDLCLPVDLCIDPSGSMST